MLPTTVQDILAEALTSKIVALLQSRIDAARERGWVGENLEYVYTEADLAWVDEQIRGKRAVS